MPIGTRKAGEFCWINILTAQPAAARDFFGTLLGWTYFEMPGMGHGIQVAGRNIGGLFDLEGPNTPPGTRAIVGVMVKVESADATCDMVIALGGTARPAFDIPGAGRMAVCGDSTGVKFDLWEPGPMPATDVDARETGAPSWFEAMTPDAAKAAEFYTALFGWSRSVMPMPNGMYTMFTLGDQPVAGMMELTPAMAGMRPDWNTYFTVNDADESAREAVRLGATISMPVREAPGRRFCRIVSPQGVPFALVAYTR